MMRAVWTALLIFAFCGAPALAQERSTLLVLDGSGSMWAQLPEGRSRIEVARDVLGDFLAARDPSAPLGVIAYGHNRKGDCSDIETLAPVGVHDGRGLGARLRGLMPRGKTPLAEALRRAGAEIPATAEAADIVLVTDGLETCGGDPCAVAAELAAAGISVRAHVVGFGLTEGELRQIACIADQTGGLVLAPQSGAELSQALLRTALAPVAEPAPPGSAAINLTIRADIAGRPDRIAFHALPEDDTGAEPRDLGVLDFATASHLTVELGEGSWRIIADAGEEGHGEIVAQIVAGENATIYVPFRGLLPSLDIAAPTGAFRAGIDGLMPYRIIAEGLATGGGDFIFSLLPLDAVDTEDRRLDYATQEARLGPHVGTFRAPAAPGEYLLVFHRNAQMPIDAVMARFAISVAARPEVQINAPPAVTPGARVPVSIAGGMGNGDRIEIWREGALYSWDQSLYLQDLFDNDYGPAKPLLAPAEPGDYELVYLFADLEGEAAIAARQPLRVGDVPDLDAAPPTPTVEETTPQLGPEAATPGDEKAAYACPADAGVPCIFDDASTGLLLALPPGWIAEQPTRAAMTAGGQPGPVRANFFSTGDPVETVVLNPHQWTTMNGPCQQVQAGQLCHFASGSATLERGLEVLSRGLRDTRPAPRDQAAAPNEAMGQAIGDLAQQDPAAAAAMRGLLTAARQGEKRDPGDAAGHGPDADGRAERAWTSYPHRCLPGDRTSDSCEVRDAASGLFFHLPETWVAEVSGIGLHPVADFFEVGPGANRIALNPAHWPDRARACAITRAGDLCRNPDLADPALARAFADLRFTLTTGRVMQRCANAPCAFSHPDPALSGHLPARWSVEVGRVLPDGRLATWFWDSGRDGALKLIGLNQQGGFDCLELQPGDRICDFTPGISDDDRALITTLLVPPAPADRRPPPGVVAAQPLSPDALRLILDSPPDR